MPLLVITGLPGAGKSTISNRIAEYFREHGFCNKIEIVCDEMDANFSRTIFADFKKEKEVRSALRSNVQRLLDRKSLVICDSLNHIKGYRYELYTVAKNSETRYALLWCEATPSTCNWLNENHTEDKRYPKDIFAALVRRFEKPDVKNRWDSPLFRAKIGEGVEQMVDESEELFGGGAHPREANLRDLNIVNEQNMPKMAELPLAELYACLAEGKELISNQCIRPQAPIASSTFLSALDCRTQTIVKRLLEMQRSAAPGDQLVVLDGKNAHTNKVNFSRPRSLPQLNRIRQQFVNFTRSHPIENLDVVGALFVDFINSNP